MATMLKALETWWASRRNAVFKVAVEWFIELSALILVFLAAEPWLSGKIGPRDAYHAATYGLLFFVFAVILQCKSIGKYDGG